MKLFLATRDIHQNFQQANKKNEDKILGEASDGKLRWQMEIFVKREKSCYKHVNQQFNFDKNRFSPLSFHYLCADKRRKEGKENITKVEVSNNVKIFAQCLIHILYENYADNINTTIFFFHTI